MYKINKLVLVLTCVSLAIIESTLLNTIRLGRIKPDLLLITVIFFGLSEGAGIGLLTGILCGLLSDALSGAVFGLNIFTMAVFGLLIGAYKNKLQRESFIIQVLMTFVTAVLAQAFYHFVLNLFVKTPAIGEYFIKLILPYALYTALVSPVLFLILGRLSPSPKYRQI